MKFSLLLTRNHVWTYETIPTGTHVHTRLFPLQPMYVHDYSHCNLRTCTKTCMDTSVQFTPLLRFLFSMDTSLPHTCNVFFLPRTKNKESWTLGHIFHSCRNSLAKITKLLGTSANSIMLTPSCLHTLYTTKCHNDLSLLYTNFRVQDRSPSTSQHQIRISCGCEAPTQTHKAHHQTHEAPTLFQWNFSPNKEFNVVPTMSPTFLTPRELDNTFPKLQKSTMSKKYMSWHHIHSKY